MTNPELLSNWRVAAKAASALATACGAELSQGPRGTKRVIHAGTIRDFPTWLAVWSFLHRIRKDQLEAKNRGYCGAPWALPVGE